MNKKCFFGLCLLVSIPLCAMHNENKKQQNSAPVVELTEREDVCSRAQECLNRLVSRGKKRRCYKKMSTYEKREKIYNTVEYGDYAVMTWDCGE